MALPPIPSLTFATSAGPSGVDAQNQVRFGNTTINTSGSPLFWVALIGAGFLLWKVLKK